MTDYASMFTRPVNRRSEISSLLQSIGASILKDVSQALSYAKENPKTGIELLAEINLQFHEVFLKVRWADGYKEMSDIRYELSDIQKIIDDARQDLQTIASIYMNENNNSM
tara:strand:- start:1318 stop:1650 length:333 start_codon:yes stop_codon:yes gene_type:complete